MVAILPEDLEDIVHSTLEVALKVLCPEGTDSTSLQKFFESHSEIRDWAGVGVVVQKKGYGLWAYCLSTYFRAQYSPRNNDLALMLLFEALEYECQNETVLGESLNQLGLKDKIAAIHAALIVVNETCNSQEVEEPVSTGPYARLINDESMLFDYIFESLLTLANGNWNAVYIQFSLSIDRSLKGKLVDQIPPHTKIKAALNTFLQIVCTHPSLIQDLHPLAFVLKLLSQNQGSTALGLRLEQCSRSVQTLHLQGVQFYYVYRQ